MWIIILVILFFLFLFPFKIKIKFKNYKDNNNINVKMFNFNFKLKLYNLLIKILKKEIKKEKKYYLEIKDKINIIKYILNKRIIKEINFIYYYCFDDYLLNIKIINLFNIFLPMLNNFNININYNVSSKNENKIYFSSIFRINLVNIIYIIIYYNLKKKRVIKNDGTSNRRLNEKCNVFFRKYD